MTVEKKVTVIPEVRKVSFVARTGGVVFSTDIRPDDLTVIHSNFSKEPVLEIYDDEIEALLELLHAVKADRAAQEPEREADSVIAVEEPTA